MFLCDNIVVIIKLYFRFLSVKLNGKKTSISKYIVNLLRFCGSCLTWLLDEIYISHIDDVKIDRLTRFTCLIQMMLRLSDKIYTTHTNDVKIDRLTRFTYLTWMMLRLTD